MSGHRAAVVRLPAWTRREHAVVREELRRWRRFTGRRNWLIGLCVVLALLALPVVCVAALGITTLLSGTDSLGPTGWVGLTGGTLAITAFALSALIGALVNLAATILSATLIAREREEQRWPFLRVAPLNSTEIVGGKLAALIYVFARPMHLAVALRLLALVVGAITGIALLFLSAPPILQFFDAVRAAGPIDWSVPPSWIVAVAVGAIDLLAGLVFWVLQPYFDGLYNAAVGLMASTLAHTRGWAIGLAFVIHFALGLAVYTPAQQVAFLISTAILAQTDPGVGIGLVGTVVLGSVQLGVGLALQAVVLVACLAASIQRVERLGE